MEALPAGKTRAASLNRKALAGACRAAMAHNAGLLLTIDELQLSTRAELGEFAATLQQHVPDHWPLVVIVAGLPSIRSTNRGVTYFERAEWHVLDMLKPAAARVALQVPAAKAGRPMSDAAAQTLSAASGGYPYAVQLMGHHAWRASTGSPSIEGHHATVAVATAQDELARGLYAARWGDASAREKEYLAALALLRSDRDQVTGAMVAHQLGRTPKALSIVRERLIQKGAIYAEAEVVRFAIPGMAAWVQQQST